MTINIILNHVFINFEKIESKLLGKIEGTDYNKSEMSPGERAFLNITEIVKKYIDENYTKLIT